MVQYFYWRYPSSWLSSKKREQIDELNTKLGPMIPSRIKKFEKYRKELDESNVRKITTTLPNTFIISRLKNKRFHSFCL